MHKNIFKRKKIIKENIGVNGYLFSGEKQISPGNFYYDRIVLCISLKFLFFV